MTNRVARKVGAAVMALDMESVADGVADILRSDLAKLAKKGVKFRKLGKELAGEAVKAAAARLVEERYAAAIAAGLVFYLDPFGNLVEYGVDALVPDQEWIPPGVQPDLSAYERIWGPNSTIGGWSHYDNEWSDHGEGTYLQFASNLSEEQVVQWVAGYAYVNLALKISEYSETVWHTKNYERWRSLEATHPNEDVFLEEVPGRAVQVRRLQPVYAAPVAAVPVAVAEPTGRPRRVGRRRGRARQRKSPPNRLGHRVARRITRIIDPFTETLDLLDAIYFALPESVRAERGGSTPQARLEAILFNLVELNVQDVVVNIVVMEVQDTLIGSLSGGALRQLRRAAGGANLRDFLFYGPGV